MDTDLKITTQSAAVPSKLKITVKGVYSSSQESTSELQSVTCDMGSHCVSNLPPDTGEWGKPYPSQTRQYLIYLPQMDEGLS